MGCIPIKMSQAEAYDVLKGTVTVENYKHRLQREFEKRGLGEEAVNTVIRGWDQVAALRDDPEYVSRFKSLFDKMDSDMDGHLDKTEMYLCLIELNELTRQGLLDMGIKTRLPDPPVHTVDAIFSSLDDDGNGWIDFEEFKILMCRFATRNYFAGAFGELKKH